MMFTTTIFNLSHCKLPIIQWALKTEVTTHLQHAIHQKSNTQLHVGVNTATVL